MERMSWLSKLTPRAGGQRPPRSTGATSPVTADPETCLMVFKNHWSQVLRVLERGGCPPTPDDVAAVRNHSLQMLQLLAEERPRAGAAQPGPILAFVAQEQVLARLLRWHARSGFPEEQRLEQLRLYEVLLAQARQAVLRHGAVRAPLLRLLRLCAQPSSPALQHGLVLLLNQLCVCVAKEPAILELFFHSPSEQGPANIIIFSLLVPFIHHEGVLGQQARDALLLIMAMSANNHAVAKSITDNSYFCPVLAAGLSALYSSLPRRLEVPGDEWHRLRRRDWLGVAPLVLFINSLEFCNAVLQVAHPLVQKQLVEYIHNGFLVPVMGPALHKTSVEEAVASTAYLELFLRSASAPALLRTFLRFLLLHRHDGSTILDTLIARINSNARLCMVSLSLFRTLLSLNCEDVMLQLVLRYLLPCSHLMLSQKRAVRDLDIYGRTAAKFLSLIPQCCQPQSPPLPPRDQEPAAWSRGPGSPTTDAAPAPAPKPSTPSRLSFFMRQHNAASDGNGAAPRSPGTPSGSPGHRAGRWDEVSELDGNYLEYLRDARHSIDRCAWACRVWSAPYDGEEPRGDGDGLPTDTTAPRPPSPRTKKRGLPEGPPGGGAGDTGTAGPSPERRESGPVVNGTHAPAAPGRPEGDVVVKKVRRRQREEEEEEEDGGEGRPRPREPLPAVDSVLDELLANAPAEPNGGTIEAFTEELQRLEARMKNGSDGDDGDEGDTEPHDPPKVPHEEEEDEEEEETFTSFTSPPPRPPDPLAQAVASPPRAVGPPPNQPFTGPGLREEQDRGVRGHAGGFPGAALQGQEVPDRAARGHRGLGHGDSPSAQRDPGPQPAAVAWGAAVAAQLQPHAAAAGPSTGATGRGGRGGPVAVGRAAEPGAARAERGLQRRHLQRVPQGAGGHRAGSRRHLALPVPAPRGRAPPLTSAAGGQRQGRTLAPSMGGCSPGTHQLLVGRAGGVWVPWEGCGAGAWGGSGGQTQLQ
ncbi:FHF complex subunit HOOK-interacting protein 1B isoform X3 [Pezoporus occidentalis]|uniref:FHF complex subunit HOOK-interacting protein 1B isoform X3 n=1 Tax=Pezoporus occidentalis TaxID=407982 RepID=UPI002F9106A7